MLHKTFKTNTGHNANANGMEPVYLKIRLNVHPTPNSTALFVSHSSSPLALECGRPSRNRPKFASLVKSPLPALVHWHYILIGPIDEPLINQRQGTPPTLNFSTGFSADLSADC